MVVKTIPALLVALMLVACAKQSTAPPVPVEEHPIHFTVVRVNAQSQTATLKHDEIKDFMGAMTMDYQIREKPQFELLRPGQSFNGIVVVKGDEMWVERVVPEPK